LAQGVRAKTSTERNHSRKCNNNLRFS